MTLSGIQNDRDSFTVRSGIDRQILSQSDVLQHKGLVELTAISLIQYYKFMYCCNAQLIILS